MRERAVAIAYGSGDWVPPVPRDACTVCLLRDSDDGVEVFLMRRTTSMAFAAGMHVYPGGAVEESDSGVPLAGRVDLADVGVRTWSERPAAMIAAAARETFEECGVLITVGDASGVGDAEREAVASGALRFDTLLRDRGLVVDDAALVPFAHWVTPEVEDRRYDTRFFATALPVGQAAARLGGEADRVAWWRPTEALAEAHAGRMAMLPPTVVTLQVLAQHDTAAAALEAMRRIEIQPVMPHPFPGDDSDDVVWHLVHDRTRVVLEGADQPSASETDGVHGGAAG